MVVTYNLHMKNFILLVCSFCFLNISVANDLRDWTNEDLCRWFDSVSIPEPISQEIGLRDLVCYDNQESSQYALETPTYNEYGTVFPSPVTKAKKKGDGIRFIFNYKITL
jgi:hypothetical protein